MIFVYLNHLIIYYCYYLLLIHIAQYIIHNLTMSLITLFNEHINTVVNTTTDINGNEKQFEKQTITYSENIDQHALLHIDLLGNTYLKYNDKYYIVSIDEYAPSGIELTKIKNPDIFRRRLIEEQNLRKGIKSGKINSNNTTLRGKAFESISNMTDEEKSDYLEKNEYLVSDNHCEEKKYFWVKYAEEDQYDEDDIEDGFYFNEIVNESDVGVIPGIVHSDLLSPVPGSFEVIMIQGDVGSKRVVSNISKIDGFCSANLTVYTSGKMKTSFMSSTKLARLCLDDNNEIITKLIID